MDLKKPILHTPSMATIGRVIFAAVIMLVLFGSYANFLSSHRIAVAQRGEVLRVWPSGFEVPGASAVPPDPADELARVMERLALETEDPEFRKLSPEEQSALITRRLKKQSDDLVVDVATSEEARREYKKLRAANDDLGVSKLLATGKVLRVRGGTKVRILDHRWFDSLYEVRILEGECMGQSGWVERGVLAKLPEGRN